MGDVTSGGQAGTNGMGLRFGGPELRVAYLVAGALMLAAGLVNITTELHDARPGLAAWKPVSWEGTSFIGSLAAFWIAFAAVRLAPLPTRQWGRAVVVHLAGTTAYSAVHCGVMWGLRWVVYAAAGAAYGGISAGQAFYEYRKDLVSYLVVAGLYWCVRELQRAQPAPGPAQDAPPAADILDIRDGARLVRAPIAEIVAVESAGNYATILLRDGTRPLMRSTLAALELTLAPHGFARVHRSWLVQTRRVRLVDPTGAGDYRLTLEGGVNVPLSRRYAGALEGVLGRRVR